MSLKYEVLKRLVKASGIKKRWVGQSTEELLENRRKKTCQKQGSLGKAFSSCKTA